MRYSLERGALCLGVVNTVGVRAWLVIAYAVLRGADGLTSLVNALA